MIKDKQVQDYLRERRKGKSQRAAAHAANINRKS